MWLESLSKIKMGIQYLSQGPRSGQEFTFRRSTKNHYAGTDPQLVLYFQQMYNDPKVDDPNSTAPAKTVNFPWQANKRVNYLIAVDSSETKTYDLSEIPAGQYSASVRLMFRAFPPYFLKELEDKAGLDPSIRIDHLPIMEMETFAIESFTF